MELPYRRRLNATEQARVPDLREALFRDAWAFFKPARGLVPKKTFHMLAEILAIAGAWEKAKRLKPAMRFCVWMYLLDYFVDEDPGVSAAHLEALQARVDAALRAPGTLTEPAFLEESLVAIRKELAETGAAPALFELFTGQISRELAASVALHRFRGGEGMGDYLALATQCVNHVSCCMSLALALGEPLTGKDGQRLLSVLQPAARAIRLANDLRTHSKDHAEGRPHALAFEWDAGRVREELGESMEAFEQALDEAGLPARTTEAMRRITRLGIEVYGITDIKLDL